jgi:hypothetical protein
MEQLVEESVKVATYHLDLLRKHPERFAVGPNKINQMITRFNELLQQVPDVIKQARTRLVDGKLVDDDQKILSLHERQIKVMLRGKAGKSVEFGNPFWLAEVSIGYIIDYNLSKTNIADSQQLLPSLERIGTLALDIKTYCTDRGVFSAKNEKLLIALGISSMLCPRGGKLAERLKTEPELGVHLKRRASTEARVAILTNEFLGEPSRAKGFANRTLAVGWAVFTHNLWVIARQPQRKVEAEEEPAPKSIVKKRSVKQLKAELKRQLDKAA